LGLRNPQRTLNKIDVIILGDSFIMASNTPEVVTLVGSLRNKGIKTYNAGMNGYSTFNALALLKILLKKTNPKVVMLGFYLGNDIRDNYLSQHGLNKPPSIENRFRKEEITPLSITDRRYHQSIQQRFRRIFNFRQNWNRIRTFVYLGIIKGYFKNPMASPSLGEMMTYSNTYNPKTIEAVRITELAIRSMASLLEDKKIKFYIFGIPSKAQALQSFYLVQDFSDDKRSLEYAVLLRTKGYSFDRPK